MSGGLLDSVLDYTVMDSITCPITGEFFLKPVIASDGFTYEEEAIKSHFETNGLSPFTRKPLDGNFIECRKIKNLVRRVLEEYPEYKAEQYVPQEKTHSNYEREIDQIIKRDRWEELREYTDYCLDCNNLRRLFKICDNMDIIKYVIDNTIDINALIRDKEFQSNDNSSYFIHVVCTYAPPEIIKYVIDKGVDLNVPEETGTKKRPIHYVCEYSTLEVVKYMIDKGVDLDAGYCGLSLFHHVCSRSKIDTIKYFIDNHPNLCDFMSKDEQISRYPIHWLAGNVNLTTYSNLPSSDDFANLMILFCSKMDMGVCSTHTS